jgi:hypothetical protein
MLVTFGKYFADLPINILKEMCDKCCYFYYFGSTGKGRFKTKCDKIQ